MIKNSNSFWLQSLISEEYRTPSGPGHAAMKARAKEVKSCRYVIVFLALSAAALRPARCKSFFRKFKASFVFMLERYIKRLRTFFHTGIRVKKLKNQVRNGIFRQMSLTLTLTLTLDVK